jgi:hypothetical protein
VTIEGAVLVILMAIYFATGFIFILILATTIVTSNFRGSILGRTVRPVFVALALVIAWPVIWKQVIEKAPHK